MNSLGYQEYEASMLQRQYWLNHQLLPNNAAYNIPSVFHMIGELNVHALNGSLQSLTEKFENLKTSFWFNNNKLLQVVASEMSIPLEIFDLNQNQVNTIDEEIYLRVNAPFDLNTRPLIRAHLLVKSRTEHYFVIVLHHIICDLHTKRVLGQAFADAYNNLLIGTKPVHAVGALQYKHYAEFHNSWLQSQEYEKMLNYWKVCLTGVDDITDFFADKKRPSMPALKGTRKYFEISSTLTSQIIEFSHKYALNPFVVNLAAYALLLHKYTGQQKFAIGVPFTNRRKEEHKDIAGCFVNILPIVADFSDDSTFHDFLSEIRKSMLMAHRNQEMPYEMLVHNSGVQRNPSYNPIFQAGFTFEPPLEINLCGIDVNPYPYNKEGSRLDQFIIMWPKGDSFQGYLEYSTDLFNEDTASRVVSNYLNILERIDLFAEKKISEISIISSIEKETTTIKWNSTDFTYRSDICIHKVFEETAARMPGSVALLFQNGSYTYKELNERANKLANYLIEAGVKIEDKIGVFVERSPEMMVAIYAILKAGAVYVPIDVNYPANRISYIIDNAQIKILFTSANSAGKVVDTPIEKIELNSEGLQFEKYNSVSPAIAVTSRNLAYMIYTSGSTGKPKGVMIEHHSVINRLFWMQRMYPLTESDIILQKTPISFDVSVWELFWWGFFGSKLCLLEAGAEKYPEKIIQTIDQFKVTVMHFVPSMLNAFLEFINNDAKVSQLKHLKYVFASGEALQVNTANRFNKSLFQTNQTKLVNLYGPTEATVDVSYYNCWSVIPFENIPIGKPIDNIQLYIVDENLNPQPIGVKGELLIGGVGVARGYFNNDELTSQKFIDNPFTKNSKIYRTGDLARFLPNGDIDYLGRMDHQVKIRGYRIELGEIDSLLHSHPLVSDAVSIVFDNGNCDKRIISYVVSNTEWKGTLPAILTQFAKDKLPEFMVPSLIVAMESFPISPNGKLDRKALPEPNLSVERNNNTLGVPGTSAEKKIYNIWKNVLQKECIGINDKFFDVGGNSLLLIQVAAKVNETFNCEIEVYKLFEYPTIALFSKYLECKDAENAGISEVDERAHKKMAMLARKRPANRM